MLWLLLIGLVVFIAVKLAKPKAAVGVIGPTNQQIAIVNTNFEPALVSHLKPLLKEEFPEAADRFTTTACATVVRGSMKDLFEKTETQDLVSAMKRIETYSEDERKELEEESDEELLEAWPVDVREVIMKAPDGPERLKQAFEAAGDAAMAEMSREL